jgi:hypothetical protein
VGLCLRHPDELPELVEPVELVESVVEPVVVVVESVEVLVVVESVVDVLDVVVVSVVVESVVDVVVVVPSVAVPSVVPVIDEAVAEPSVGPVALSLMLLLPGPAMSRLDGRSSRIGMSGRPGPAESLSTLSDTTQRPMMPGLKQASPDRSFSPSA